LENNENTLGVSSPVKELVRKLQENKNSLNISRVPPKTLEIFISIADEDFCSDYGMLLKTLVDKYIEFGSSDLILQLQNHEDRISNLEKNKKEDEPESKVKLLNGKRLGNK